MSISIKMREFVLWVVCTGLLFLGIFFVCLLKVLFSPVLHFILHQNNFSSGTEFQTIHKKMLILKITDSDRKTDYH